MGPFIIPLKLNAYIVLFRPKSNHCSICISNVDFYLHRFRLVQGSDFPSLLYIKPVGMETIQGRLNVNIFGGIFGQLES